MVQEPEQSESPLLRAFIAVDVNDDVREALAHVQTGLKRTHAHVSWVPAPNLHLSLFFLGDISLETAHLVGLALDEAVKELSPFQIEVEKLGTFPPHGSPRVIWAGTTGDDSLHALYQRVGEQLRHIRVEIESRKFTPHITLGRVRSSRGRNALVHKIREAEESRFGNVSVREVRLMKSVRGDKGVRYEEMHKAAFAEAES